jgi:hypothetical protein
MGLKRVLALLAAVAMIAGALQLRALREDAGEGPVANPGRPSGGALTLSCADVLASVCQDLVPLLADDGLEVAVSSPTSVAGGAAPARGALLTLAPLAGLAPAPVAGGPEVAAEEGRVLARSPLVVAVWEDREAVLVEHCGSLTWRCVGEGTTGSGTWQAMGGPASWGPVKPGHADPVISEAGVLVLGHLAASYFGQAEVSSRDLDDLGFFTWFSSLEQAVPGFRPSSGSPLLAMLQFGPSSYDVVGVVEAEAVPLLARAVDRAGTLRLRPVEPLATADVQVTAVGSDGGVEELVAAVSEHAPALLAQAGWRVEDVAPEGALAQVGVQDLGTLPTGTGLPSAGTHEALRRTWSEVTR